MSVPVTVMWCCVQYAKEDVVEESGRLRFNRDLDKVLSESSRCLLLEVVDRVAFAVK